MRPRLFLKCPECTEFKHPDLFYPNVRSCRACIKKRNAIRYAKIKEAGVTSLHKRCPRCGKTKPAKDFSKSVGHVDGLCTYCRKCRSGIRQTPEGRAATNKAKVRLRETRPEHYVARQMVISARRRAKTKELPFNITTKYVLSLLPEVCPVFGTSLDYNSSKTSPNSPTLDRFIPEDGYVIGNVFVISHKANTIKNNASIDELRLLLQWMSHVRPSVPFSKSK